VRLGDCRFLLDAAFRDWARSRDTYLRTLATASPAEIAAMVEHTDRAFRDYVAVLAELPNPAFEFLRLWTAMSHAAQALPKAPPRPVSAL
jgi:hypothetical protein